MSGYEFAPDYAVPPGETLQEMLETQGMTQAALARHMGRPRKTIHGIIHGDVQITPETAIELERVLGTPARLWLNLEQNYRADLARIAEAQRLTTKTEWLQNFPLKEMIQRGLITAANAISQLHQILSFLGYAHPEAWEALHQEERQAFRMARTFEQKNDRYALAVWLREGERQAQDILCQPYDRARFESALRALRSATRLTPDQFYAEMRRLCAEAGVAVVIVPELEKTHICGATYWISSTKAVIQLSMRYKTSDSLWFTFYHEAGHIILHGTTETFLEGESDHDEKEQAADDFASNMLIPKATWRQFTSTRPFSAERILEFAEKQQIGPGIIVGRLRHDHRIRHETHKNMVVSLKDWLPTTDIDERLTS